MTMTQQFTAALLLPQRSTRNRNSKQRPRGNRPTLRQHRHQHPPDREPGTPDPRPDILTSKHAEHQRKGQDNDHDHANSQPLKKLHQDPRQICRQSVHGRHTDGMTRFSSRSSSLASFGRWNTAPISCGSSSTTGTHWRCLSTTKKAALTAYSRGSSPSAAHDSQKSNRLRIRGKFPHHVLSPEAPLIPCGPGRLTTETSALSRSAGLHYFAKERRVAMSSELGERFWSKVDVGGPGDCWEWKAGRNAGGYGQFRLGGKPHLAHRLVVGLRTGDEGHALHSCDNPACVNPAHLSIGTHQDNMDQMKSRGRQSSLPGEDHGQAKLTDTKVLEIRARYATGQITQRGLASQYDVAHSLISMIINRKNWKHI